VTSNLETLAGLFGTRAALAEVFEVDKSYVTRLLKNPIARVPIRYNAKVRVAMRERALKMGLTEAAAFVEAVERCLDAATCPTCGRPLDAGQVV
jgi:hypothetical protein